MDTFTITGYNRDTRVVTATVVLAARGGFAGETLTGLRLSNPPTDSVESVKAFFRAHADAYIAGKVAEQAKKVDIANEVKALLNVATSF